MVACIPITQEKIRAEIWMGSTLLAKTPFVRSFSVTKSRGQFTNSFNLTVEIIAGLAFPMGENIRILAGTKGNLKPIFTGLIEASSARPSFGKPSYFSLTLSGRGVLSELENKKFSRRLKSDGQGLFCTITGGSSNRPDSFNSLDRATYAGRRQTTNLSPNPAKKSGEQSPVVVAGGSSPTGGGGGAGGAVATGASSGIASLAKRTIGADSQDSSTGLSNHTHEDLNQGGPAFGVYSAD